MSICFMRHLLITSIAAMLLLSALAAAAPLLAPDNDRFTREAADRMLQVGQGTLAPVYAPLAEQIVTDYNLAELEAGIGVDLGGGAGYLTLELCEGTRMHWVLADINPHFFAGFLARAEDRGVGHRVSAIFADAQALPFRDGYADVVVSRGSYHFWDDMLLGFREIMRVLKPGGVAYIGRGFARDMPVDVASPIRDKQGDTMVYDRQAAAAALEAVFEELGIDTYRIEIPEAPDGGTLNYGIWVELRAPLAATN